MVLSSHREARRPVVDLDAMVGLGQPCRPPWDRDREDQYDAAADRAAADDDRLTELAARLVMLFK